MYTGNDHARQATSYSRTASAATRRAERRAHQAQECYTQAGVKGRMAASLTRQPARWLPEAGYTPADVETEARCWLSMADSYLRQSFSATEAAGHYRELAARYRELAARRAVRLAGREREGTR